MLSKFENVFKFKRDESEKRPNLFQQPMSGI